MRPRNPLLFWLMAGSLIAIGVVLLILHVTQLSPGGGV
jgi:hypothetical protein